MNKILLLITLCTAAAPITKLEPWQRIEIDGYVRSEEGFQLFGSTEKRLMLETPNEWNYSTYAQLGFANNADYRHAEKCVDQAVKIEGYVVRRGAETWVVPIVLRERK